VTRYMLHDSFHNWPPLDVCGSQSVPQFAAAHHYLILRNKTIVHSTEP